MNIHRSFRKRKLSPLFSGVLSEKRKLYYDGVIAISFIFASQFLICGLQQITAHLNHFPASILAMLLIAFTMIIISEFVFDLDNTYKRHLSSAMNLINKHMSIGFTVPFTLIMKDPMPSSKNVGIIIVGYRIINSILVFLFSLSVQTVLGYKTKKGTYQEDLEALENTSEQEARPGTIAGRVPCRLQQDQGGSYPCGSSATANDISPQWDDSHQQRDSSHHSMSFRDRVLTLNSRHLFHLGRNLGRFIKDDPILCFSLSGMLAIGYPIAQTTGNDTALDTFFLLFLWTGTLSAQATVKKKKKQQAPYLCKHSRLRTIAATSLNAVLWTSLGNIAYTAAKSAIKHCTISESLSLFKTGATLADLIHAAPHQPQLTAMGAGDVASSILNAGIVSWGLKLFECRNQLLSHAGLATLLTSSAFAAMNIVCGPLLVHSMGLEPSSRALAFAARSATLALAEPAMTSLGGDVGLNAALVVFNGITFQVMMDLGARRWFSRAGRFVSLSKGDETVAAPADALSPAVPNSMQNLPRLMPTVIELALPEAGRLKTVHCANSHNIDKGNGVKSSHEGEQHTQESVESVRGGEDDAAVIKPHDSPTAVPMGITVGVNAAAMGAAYLYDEASQAAPYAALSMTLFGVMTVVFTSIKSLDNWLIMRVA